MTRRPANLPSKPQRPILTVDQKRRGVARLQKRIEELEAFDPQTVQRRFTDPNVTALETSIDEALSSVFGHETVEYERYRWATQLDHGPVTMRIDPGLLGGRSSHRDDAQEARQHIAKGKEEALSLLRQAVRSVTEEIEEESQDASPPLMIRNQNPRSSSKVFVVHGHDEGAKHSVARFLQQLELEAIILQEQPDQGLTIIEKFEKHADEVGFAVVIFDARRHRRVYFSASIDHACSAKCNF